jgi:SAM-dependent methyltransferase
VVRVTALRVRWHEVENDAYEADLPLWRELAEAEGGPILDLGAGTGRVAADLSARGHEVVALDSDPELLEALEERAPAVVTVQADAREFALECRFALAIAPMQLLQILGGRAGRTAMLRCVHAHLVSGGMFAAAVAEPREAVPAGEAVPPLPDMLEHEGWVYSSQPLSVEEQSGRVVVTRRRQAVSPAGALDEELVEIALDLVDMDELRRELEACGFAEPELREIPETPDHIGSAVVLCRR